MFAGTKKLMSRAALVLAATVALGACEDSTGSDDHDHDEAAGVVVLNEAGATLVTVNAARQVTGALTVQAGQDADLEVWFVAEDGDRFQPDGDDHTLGIEVANEAIADLHAHDDHLHLEGLAAGSTTVVFSIQHGNHADYESPAIPITVTP